MTGLSMMIHFYPKPFSMLEAISSDVVVGGSIIGRMPSLYKVSVNIKMMNPLPTACRLDQVHVEAYHKSLGGADLYNFTRSEQDLGDNYWIQPKASGDQVIAFQVFPLSGEFKIPGSISVTEELIKEAAAEDITVGINVTIHATVGGEPGFYQRVEYTNRALNAALCYHVLEPTHSCNMGSGGAARAIAPLLVEYPSGLHVGT